MPIGATVRRLHTVPGLRSKYLPGPGDIPEGNEVVVKTIWGNVAPGRQTVGQVTFDIPKFEYIDLDFMIPPFSAISPSNLQNRLARTCAREQFEEHGRWSSRPRSIYSASSAVVRPARIYPNR